MNKARAHASGNPATGAVGRSQAFVSVCAGPLAPGASDCVEIRVNGKLLALGELVQLEDRLGVELHEVYHDGVAQ